MLPCITTFKRFMRMCFVCVYSKISCLHIGGCRHWRLHCFPLSLKRRVCAECAGRQGFFLIVFVSSWLLFDGHVFASAAEGPGIISERSDAAINAVMQHFEEAYHPLCLIVLMQSKRRNDRSIMDGSSIIMIKNLCHDASRILLKHPKRLDSTQPPQGWV